MGGGGTRRHKKSTMMEWGIVGGDWGWETSGGTTCFIGIKIW